MPTNLDPGQVIKGAYDETNQAIQVNVVAQIPGANSVSIVDGNGGTDKVTVTAASELKVLASAQPGTDIGDVTVNNAGGASAVNIQDGGNSITVDGTVAATQSGTWNITNVSGTVSLPTGAATEATLSSLNGKVTAVNTGAVVVSSSALPTGASTEATLSSLNAKVTAVNTGAVVVSSSALPTGAATETTLSAFSAKSASSAITVPFDYQAITYVGATTDIATVVYKTGGSGGTTVATLTMGYDGSNRLTSVTKS